ncbi:MAG: DoxX family protein [Nanoarchaeota archaeon]|nr:DoxX family protein [Nanoarchaeota archaeon]
MNINKEYAPVILRIGISLTFLWFGLTQIFNPASLSVYLPNFVYSLSVDPLTFVRINGIFEAILGLFLLVGYHTRLSSFILGIHLLIISFGLGYNDIAVRDVGLVFAIFAIFFYGNDRWCYDWEKK